MRRDLSFATILTMKREKCLPKHHLSANLLGMDDIDRKIAEILQVKGRASNAEIANAVGVSVSTASERVRKLSASGAVTAWRAVLNPRRFGADLLAFVFLDMQYQGEEEACQQLSRRPEVQELHHVSGARSYLMKVRVADTDALQLFLQKVVKPLTTVVRTETIVVLDKVKETSEMFVAPSAESESTE
jgi:Lrp/AsnC family leucine-responsive transcriptional regulator